MCRIPWALALLALLGAESARGGSDLEACLRGNVSWVVVPDRWPGSWSYDLARQCRNRRTDIIPSPLAIARVKSAREVQAAVLCAAAADVEACARAGAHGFDNDAGCSGGLIIDVQDLQSLAVDAATKVVQFDAGLTLGQLYYRLKTDHGLVVPGGAVSGVGAAGLFLGCGRGMLTQLHGLACDSILGVEFVDARGVLRTASANSSADMYWMARGGGGTFPGIVTRFTVQAFDAPVSLYAFDCIFPSYRGKALIKEWLGSLEQMTRPERRTFTHVSVWAGINVRFSNICIDCTPAQKTWFEQMVEGVANRAGEANCNRYSHTWFDQLLYDSGSHQDIIENHPSALLDRNQGWGAKGPFLASRNGAHMVFDYYMSDALINTMMDWAFDRAPEQHAYGICLLLYPMGGAKVEEVAVGDTPYGGRSAKIVLHYKHQWDKDSVSAQELMSQHHEGMARAFDKHLPCKGYYNYLDNRKTCAHTNDEWLDAYFYNVRRMKDIKIAEDPTNVFRSRLFHAPEMISITTTTGTTTRAVTLTTTLGSSTTSTLGSSTTTAQEVATTTSTTATATTRTTSTSTTTASSACSAHRGCQGLIGACCPTRWGWWYPCCHWV